MNSSKCKQKWNVKFSRNKKSKQNEYKDKRCNDKRKGLKFYKLSCINKRKNRKEDRKKRSLSWKNKRRELGLSKFRQKSS